MKAFDVLVLQDFGTFHSSRHIIFIGENRPSTEDLQLKENEKTLRMKEVDCQVIIKEKK